MAGQSMKDFDREAFTLDTTTQRQAITAFLIGELKEIKVALGKLV